MVGDGNDNDTVSNQVNAIANLAKAVPVYDDAFRPIMQETGKALGTVGRAVNVALGPIRGLVWGAEQIENWLASRVAGKLVDLDETDIVTPDPSIAGPTIEALRFNGHKPELSEMFAGLLASAMSLQKKDLTHPTFVEKIRSMTALDAQIFAFICDLEAVPTVNITRVFENTPGAADTYCFVNNEMVGIANRLKIGTGKVFEAVEGSIENLQELGLIRARSEAQLTSKAHQEKYVLMRDEPFLSAFKEPPVGADFKWEIKNSCVVLTRTGRHFREAIF